MNMKKNLKHFKIVNNSPVIIGFVIICCIVQIINTLTGGRSTTMFFSCNFSSSWKNPLTWLTYVTFGFGHISWEHLFGNMCYILLIGPLIEEKYGSLDTVLIMLASTISTGVIGHIFFPSSGVVGASGIVFTFLILSSITSVTSGIPITLILVSVFYLLPEIKKWVLREDLNVSHFGHIIGGCVGILLGLFLRKGKHEET